MIQDMDELPHQEYRRPSWVNALHLGSLYVFGCQLASFAEP